MKHDSDIEQLRRRLTASPALYPFAVDLPGDRIRFVPLTLAEYAAASFLDERLGIPDADGSWCPWDGVSQAIAGLPEQCHFIFHISHVGSTLLSRLLGQHSALFSLREPAVLRNLADIHLALGHARCPWSPPIFDVRLGVCLALWSRTFLTGQTAVIKATSFVSEMAEHLMARVRDSRSILMYVPPMTFLKVLLDGAIKDISRAAGKRLFRLHRRLGGEQWRLQDFSVGEQVAMSWLSEMLALHASGRQFPERSLWIDFDQFLAAPEPCLIGALRHFAAADAETIAREILSGPTLSQYSKAPERKYDSGLRDRLLKRGEERHAAEIRKGMDWLERAAAIPVVREVLELATRSAGIRG